MQNVAFALFLPKMVVVAQLVRAPDCGSGGRRFETDLPPQKTKGLQQCSPFFYGLYPTARNQNMNLLTGRLTLKFSYLVGTFWHLFGIF